MWTWHSYTYCGKVNRHNHYTWVSVMQQQERDTPHLLCAVLIKDCYGPTFFHEVTNQIYVHQCLNVHQLHCSGFQPFVITHFQYPLSDLSCPVPTNHFQGCYTIFITGTLLNFWNKIPVLCWKLALISMTVLLVPTNHNHKDYEPTRDGEFYN
jgi:hypothetical protein